jgi:hypothetical protein
MPSLVHSKSLLSPFISLKALFEVFGMRNALEALKIYLIYMFRGMLQAEIRYCGSRIYVDHKNIKQLVELSRKLERVIKAGGKVSCYKGNLYINLNGKFICRLFKPKIAIDDILAGPLLGIAYEIDEYMMMKEAFVTYLDYLILKRFYLLILVVTLVATLFVLVNTGSKL